MTGPTARFARYARTLREQYRWSQQEVADRMTAEGFRWYQSTVQKFEAGQRKGLTLDQADALGRIFGINVFTNPHIFPPRKERTMPKLIVTWEEVKAVIGRQQVIEVDGVDHVDVLALVDALRELAGPMPLPAVTVREFKRPVFAAFEDSSQSLPDDDLRRTGAREPCPHCGATAGRDRWDDDPDSAFCVACGRHWRTGHTREVWAGIRAGAVGPAPAEVPKPPLGPIVDDIDPATRLAPRLARLPDLEPIDDYFPGGADDT